MHAIILLAAGLLAPLSHALTVPGPRSARAVAAATFCEKVMPATVDPEAVEGDDDEKPVEGEEDVEGGEIIFTAEVMQERFDLFATAFLVDKNMDEAFSYIAPEYVNHNPMASDGAQVAYDILSPIWPGLNIEVLATTYHHNESMGWLNYNTGSFGTVVDRYRLEGGCIVEHWDQGEQFPSGE